MLKRVMTVVVGLPLLIFLIYLGGLPLLILVAGISVLGLRELYVAVSGKFMRIHAIGIGIAIGYFLAIYLRGLWYPQLIAIALLMVFIQICLVVFYRKCELLDIFAVVYGFMYIPFLLSFIIMLRSGTYGMFYVWLIFTTAFGCDTFAFLTGSAIGKHKLSNSPSPSKTVEGLIGGLVGAVLVSSVYAVIMQRFSYNFYSPRFIVHAIIISAVTAVFCVFGDMAASVIKRKTGIKDFSNVFPGHGGVIDRIDSIVIAAPVVFMIVTLLKGM